MKTLPYLVILLFISIAVGVIADFRSCGKHPFDIGTYEDHLDYCGDRYSVVDKNDVQPVQMNVNTGLDSLCGGVYSRVQARRDIKSGKARLLVQGGIVPVYYPADRSFQDTYKIRYEIFGCVAPAKIECLEAYNKVVFEHLQHSYGDIWKDYVRRDVIGLGP
ncbi:hypothetical protein [Flavihumibacter sp. CACIAM 22H1]|uniref:FEKKY domain-containing protein n=1 Tax=Flavihumibacter sp. CACIAM 22H1 TaxID=1812911 RepID=UPI0007A8E4B2|nr:hypothetical protein [Flavihumibacter sp. CACIAM 22H1]KYP13540.1 MAG: hypothetical protein A1D16_17420 [Flavihumibacter sp. CACIAM 22H1]